MEERDHFINVLKDTQSALKSNNSLKLKTLSDQTIHTASISQHTDSLIIAVVIYSLSKLVERRENLKLKNWDKFAGKIYLSLEIAIKALQENKDKKFLEGLERVKKNLLNVSPSIKKYVEEVLIKASINKASKLYEHGISMSQTANLLGVSQWELSEYIGQKSIHETPEYKTIDIKSRAKMAMEFFK